MSNRAIGVREFGGRQIVDVRTDSGEVPVYFRLGRWRDWRSDKVVSQNLAAVARRAIHADSLKATERRYWNMRKGRV